MKAPDVIYLQWYGDENPEFISPCEDQYYTPDVDATSFSYERIFEYDITYMRSDMCMPKVRSLTDDECKDLYIAMMFRGKDVSIFEAIRQWFAKIQGGAE